MADFLVNIALKRDDVTLGGITEVEFKTRPTIPDNIHNWQVFDNNSDIINFLHCADHYENQEIDFNAFVEEHDGKETLFGQEIVQLKTNKIPRGLIALEKAFDGHNRFKMKDTPMIQNDLEEINLGTQETPKNVYIRKNLNPKIRSRLINLLRKYRHVFAWSYDDLKAYREDMF